MVPLMNCGARKFIAKPNNQYHSERWFHSIGGGFVRCIAANVGIVVECRMALLILPE
jgi:hypothetical protein